MSRQKIIGAALLVHPDGTLERIETTWPPKLEALQAWVQGYIEMVRMAEGLVAIVNEEGRLIGMPQNARYPNLCGPVVLCGERLYSSGEGEGGEGDGGDGGDPGEGGEGDPPEPDLGPLDEAQLGMLEGGGVASGWRTAYMDRTKTIPDEELVVRVIDPSRAFRGGKG